MKSKKSKRKQHAKVMKIFPQVKGEMTTKQKILHMLKEKKMRPFELSKVLKLTRGTVSEHLQDLTKQKKVKWEGTHKVRYYLLREGFSQKAKRILKR